MNFPMIDPVIFEIGPLQVRWYGVMYILGFASAYLVLLYLTRRKYFRMERKDVEDLLVYCIVGLLLGARLGYSIFYNLDFYFANPMRIFAVWEGGMSFHGGLIGVVIAGLIFAKKRKKSFLMLSDMAAVAAPPGLFFGRIGNFINAELYGRVTDVPWGMVFPGAGPFPRHPSQLYQALLEGALLFAVMLWMSMTERARGTLIASFLVVYGLARIFVEFFREPDAHIGFVVGFLTMGQVLSIIMIAAGAGLFAWQKAYIRKQR